jgi:hypothetical protein
MARRRRGQFPKPKKENGQWKIRYWTDQAQPDGSIRRVRKTKCLGKLSEITSREAQKEAQRFLQPINDVVEGIEHAEKTVSQLIAQWQVAVKPNLKLSTQANYEWAYARARAFFGHVAVSDISKADVQEFLTASSRDSLLSRCGTSELGCAHCFSWEKNGIGFYGAETRRGDVSAYRPGFRLAKSESQLPRSFGFSS